MSTDISGSAKEVSWKYGMQRSAMLPRSPQWRRRAFRLRKRRPKRSLPSGIRHYGNHFWLMFDGEKLIAFVDGFVTDEPDLTDGMYETASMHDETGAWQMIFGVNTLPAYRRHRVCGRADPPRRFRCETAGAQGTCTDLQTSPDPVLCAFRLCGRGCFGEIHPRERRVAPDAAVLLTAIRTQIRSGFRAIPAEPGNAGNS